MSSSFFVAMPTTTPPRIRELQRQIATLGQIFTGTLSRRMKQCGKPRCACHSDPDALHGPYLEWSRREHGRFVTTTVMPEVAEVLVRGIMEHHKLDDLIAAWESASTATLPPSDGVARSKSSASAKGKRRQTGIPSPRARRKRAAAKR